MKVCIGACPMALLLLLALCSQTFCDTEQMTLPTSCCFSYTARQIPFRLLTDYYRTGTQCSQPGIVFITNRGREICANPADQWVQHYINRLAEN